MTTAYLFFAAGGVLAALYLPLTQSAPSGARSAIKTGATMALVLAGLAAAAPGWVVLALALGALGDFFLSRDPGRWFLPGLVAFALGHLAYIAGLWGMAGVVPLWPAILLGAAAAGLLRAVWSGLDALRAPVVVYAALSVVLGALAWAQTETAIIAGVMGFVASDVVLAVSLFGLPAQARAQRVLGPLLWALYWAGQAMILWGVTGAA